MTTLDSALAVSFRAGPSWAARLQTDQSYELAVVNSSAFKWRRFPVGAPGPDGDFLGGATGSALLSTSPVTLELGVTVTFGSTSGKAVGDAWSFTALTLNPSLTAAAVLGARDALCAVPPYAPLEPDLDVLTPGLQHQVRLSLRGARGGFGAVQMYAQPGGPATLTAAGTPQTPMAPWSPGSALRVDGYYSGDVAMMYEVTIASSTTFTWRRYSASPASCDAVVMSAGVAIVGGDVSPTAAWQALDQGVLVRFELQGSKPGVGTSWVFSAVPAWSSAFSPVAETSGGAAAGATPPARLLPSGALTAAAGGSWVYEVNVTVAGGASTFSWRRWAYGSSNATASNTTTGLAVAISPAAPTPLELGVAVSWSAALPSSSANRSWQFTAFTGHTVTFGATSSAGAVSASSASAVAFAVTDASGAANVPAFLGGQRTLYTLTVLSGGATFDWRSDAGDGASAVRIVAATPTPLSQGVYVSWAGGSSTAGAAFTFWAAPVPSSASAPAPVAPTVAAAPFAVLGAYAPGGAFATRSATLSVLLTNSTAFSWRNNTAPFSAPLLIPVASPYTVAVGDTGLLLRFTAGASFTAGARYSLLVSSFVPALDNVTSVHAGARAAPALSSAAAAAANVGLPTGVAVPYPANSAVTGASPTLSKVLPTPGFVVPWGMLSAASGRGLASPLPAGYPSSAAPGAYPPLVLRIVGTPGVGAVSGQLPRELSVSGAYTYGSTLLYDVVANSSASGGFQWRATAPGATAGGYTAGKSVGNGLTLTFGSGSYPDATAWYFAANAGHSYQFARDGTSAWSAEAAIVAVSPASTDLCCGVSVVFSATTGYTPGDTWALLPLTVAPSGAYSGADDALFELAANGSSTFSWRKDGGAWSALMAISGVDRVLGDRANAGSNANRSDVQLANVDVVSGGRYNGSGDALFVAEVLFGGASFRWAAAPPVPGLAAALGSPAGAAAIGAYLSSPALSWTSASISGNASNALAQGVTLTFMQFGGAARVWQAGDVYYVAARSGRTVSLSEGVSVTWSAPSGYSAGDLWAFTAAAAHAARGPLGGGTEAVVLGRGLLPSSSLSCRFVDVAGRLAAAVPATYVSPTEARCRTPARAADGLTVPVGPTRAAAPLLALSGAYLGPATVSYSLSVVSNSSALLVTATASGSGVPVALGTLAALADGSTWFALPLPDGRAASGVFARLQVAASAACAGAAYQAGDSWQFTAFALDAAAQGGGDAHPEVALGSVKPGLWVNVSLSNDGLAWSDSGYGTAGPGLLRFLYSPIYASPSGDDAAGDGTRAAPYGSLSRSVGAALSDARGGQAGQPAGLASVVNWDNIVLLPGRFQGAGNTGVAPGGRALLVSAAARGAAVIDCAGGGGGDVLAGDKFAQPGRASAGSISLQGVATENCGAAYTGNALAYPTMRWWGAA